METPKPLASDYRELPLISIPHGSKPTLWGFVRSRFVTGILVAFPLVVTLFFARFLFNLLDRWFYPWSMRFFGFAIPGLGVSISLILVFFLGIAAHNVLGRRLLRLGEKLLTSIPIIRPVYLGAREVSRAFSRDRAQGFRRVVLIPFPGEGAWCVAFQTAEFTAEGSYGPVPMVAVFMPTTPNPTTGFFLAYPKEQVRYTDLSVEEAVRTVISGGLAAADLEKVFSKVKT